MRLGVLTTLAIVLGAVAVLVQRSNHIWAPSNVAAREQAARTYLQQNGLRIAVDPPKPPSTQRVATVYVRINDAGTPIELSTNTGLPPAGYETIVVLRDGQRVQVPPTLPGQIFKAKYAGDWSDESVWHKFTP